MTTKAEQEDNAREFCEELHSLIDVCEVRGCNRHRMGQSLIGIGISCMNDDNGDIEHTKRHAQATMRAWLEILSKED